MKIMTCKQLGGACNERFIADTFEKVAEMSKKHGIEMLQKGEKAHLEAMKKMQKLMESEGDMAEWMEAKRKEFDALPEIK
jgi:hypothetical protein